MSISAQTAKEHLDAWLEAELIVTGGQSYSIGPRTLTRANLSEIRTSIEYWNNKLNIANNISKRKGKNRVMRIVPRDL